MINYQFLIKYNQPRSYYKYCFFQNITFRYHHFFLLQIKTFITNFTILYNFLMQFQSDILGVTVDRPQVIESTALGAAYFAGIKAGFWTLNELSESRKSERLFVPNMDQEKRDRIYKGWGKAVTRTMNWID